VVGIVVKPTVSIIIPCYKSEKYIRQCVDSILAQTFTDWEAIFFDDKPSRAMVATMTAYMNEDSRIRYYGRWKKTNPANARNRGIDCARGRYVAFLDADDWWAPDKLELMVEILDEHLEVEWCAHYLTEVYPDRQIQTRVYPGHDMSIGGTGVILIRRETLFKIESVRGYIFDEKMDRNDDADLILHIRKIPSLLVPYHLSYMRMREEGLTSNTGNWQRLKIIVGMAIRRMVSSYSTPCCSCFSLPASTR
jgi:glycosyltransferase involved in cell wall biosynthesis